MVVNGDVLHYESGCLHPNDDAVSRRCPQCRQTTWRYTQHCMHCNLDLSDWDRQRALMARRASLQRSAHRLMGIGIGFLISSWAMNSLDWWKEGQLGAVVIGVILFVMAGKLLEDR